MSGLSTPWALSLKAMEQPNVLVVRNDGLGDFILTLPLIASLKAQLPGCRITVLVSPVVATLAPLLLDIDAVVVDEGVLLKRNRGRFDEQSKQEKRKALLGTLREGGYDAALLPYAETGSAALVHQAGIPLRVGPLRRTFFWRFNAWNARSRKGSTRAEYALNLDLLTSLGLKPTFHLPALAPQLDAKHAGGGGRGGGSGKDAPPVVMHPYKRNATALSWPLENFATLAAELAQAGCPVLVVGDEEDAPVLEKHFGGRQGITLSTRNTLPELAELIAGAGLFLGSSSGPLHLAGLIRTAHVGLYPKSRVSAPTRWATLPAASDAPPSSAYLLAPENPKSCVVCEGERCPYFNCVASLSLEQVRRAIRAWGFEYL